MKNSFKLVAIISLIFLGTVKPSFAEFSYTESSLGFDLGLVIPDHGQDATFGWGGIVNFAFSLGEYGELHFRPNIEFWFSSDKDDDVDHLDVFQTALNGDVRYYFALPRTIPIKPFIGNGIVIQINHKSWEHPNDPNRDFSETDPAPGFTFLTGLDFPLSESLTAFFEFKSTFSDYDVLKFNGGLMFSLGR